MKLSDYISADLIQEGWRCPICKHVLSPYQPYCMFCGGHTIKSNGAVSDSDTNMSWLDQIINSAPENSMLNQVSVNAKEISKTVSTNGKDRRN